MADLFNNALDINTNLPMWTRNTCKYGDNFIYLRLDPEKGLLVVFNYLTLKLKDMNLVCRKELIPLLSTDLTKTQRIEIHLESKKHGFPTLGNRSL